jgi:hypothetical protein
MPRLRDTRLQIQERTAREIRHRTAARVAELYREAEDGRQAIERHTVVCNIVEENRAEEHLPRHCERCRRFDQFCNRIACVVSFSFCSFLIVCIMPIRKDRPFKSPRQARPRKVSKDSDEDETPIAQTLETTKQSYVHRKDNSEWGKRMEKKLGEMDKRREEADNSKMTAEIDTEIEKGETPLQNKRKSAFRRMNTALDNKQSSD